VNCCANAIAAWNSRIPVKSLGNVHRRSPRLVAVALLSHCVLDESLRASTVSLFSPGEFGLVDRIFALSRAAQVLLGQFTHLNWP
jgi:hypothetical protein